MRRLLAVSTVLLIALLALLLVQTRGTVAPPARRAEAPPAPRTTPAAVMQPASDLAAAQEQIVKASKLDPASDAFFYRFDEQIPPALTMEAATCYTTNVKRVHRNQSAKLTYTIQIKGGVVSVSNVKVVDSSITDKQLEECFARKIAAMTWRDDELPDWRQDDELVISPERGMKKFTAENIAYKGEEPTETLEDPGDVAGSRELPR